MQLEDLHIKPLFSKSNRTSESTNPLIIQILDSYEKDTILVAVCSTDEGIASESRSSMIPKPNYRMRKERKTGLTTIELQRRFPDLYEAATKAQDEGTAPTTCSAVKNTGSVTFCGVCTASICKLKYHQLVCTV